MKQVPHESCECKCGLNESVCNSKQKRNHYKCWCECKELNDWRCCDCECNKACKFHEYLDIKNCSCERHLFVN